MPQARLSIEQLFERAQNALDHAIAKIRTAEHYMTLLRGRGEEVDPLINEVETARMDLDRVYSELDEY
jgi:hypothetical protein